MELKNELDADFTIDTITEFPLKEIKKSGLQKWQIEYYLNLLDYWELSVGFFTMIIKILPKSTIDELLDICAKKEVEEDDKMEEVRNKTKYRRILQGKYNNEVEDSILEYMRLKKSNEYEIYTILKKSLIQNYRECENVSQLFYERLAELQKIFEFEDNEMELIRFHLTMGINGCYDNFIKDHRNSRTYEEICEIVSCATKIPKGALYHIIKKDNKLLQLEILENERSVEFPNNLDEEINDFLLGLSENNFVDRFFFIDSKPVSNPSVFRLTEYNIEITKSLLNSTEKANILLYGSPGTGKTEFARSIISEIRKQAYFVTPPGTNRSSQKNRNDSLNRNLFVTLSIAEKNNGVVVFDEADSFLNRGFFGFEGLYNGDKGWLNRYLDQSNAKIIWITNHTNNMDDSSKRRFQYSIHFKDFSKKERIIVWNSILENSLLKNFISTEYIEKSAEIYSVNPGGIKNAVSTAENTLKNNTKLNENLVESILSEILSQQMELTQGKKPQKARTDVHAYDPKILNTDKNLQELENSVSRFFHHMEAYGKNKSAQNLNLLLWGMPGTGKTEFAKYLAKTHKKDLIIKKASDLLSMWVGGSEKLIRSAFDDAERNESLLLIDEADSFLQNREGAQRSWEITQVNEFLTCMENFSGILICTTNFMNNLDPASIRRFSWKVEFKPLRNSDKVTLFKNYFNTLSDTENLTQREIMKIEDIQNLTPGDFKAIWNRVKYSVDGMTVDSLIGELESEVSYKIENKNKVGFGG